MIWPFRKKPAPAPAPEPKMKPVRITVMLKDGRYVTHRAIRRRIDRDGGLHLFDADDGGDVVADYAPGTWVSMSAGKRCVTHGKD